jgi:hypothetical protein
MHCYYLMAIVELEREHSNSSIYFTDTVPIDCGAAADERGGGGASTLMYMCGIASTRSKCRTRTMKYE